MLVDIYGTRELFVNEYRALLADRLLTQFMDNIGDEIRYLELLKLRQVLIIPKNSSKICIYIFYKLINIYIYTL